MDVNQGKGRIWMSTRAKAPYMHGIDEGNEHQKTGIYMASILAKGDHLWKFMTVIVMLAKSRPR